MQCVNGGILRGELRQKGQFVGVSEKLAGAGLPDLAARISVAAYWGVGLWIVGTKRWCNKVI
jgi:hypothetical protein